MISSKNKTHSGNRKYSREELKYLAEKQITRLSKKLKGLKVVEEDKIKEIIDNLNNGLDAAMGVAMGTWFVSGHIPLIPVISRKYLSVSAQIQLTSYNGKTGRCGAVNPDGTQDTVKCSFSPDEECYWMVSVEDGTDFYNISPSVAKDSISLKNRDCLILPEIIALVIHSNVLFRHSICAVNSRYQDMIVNLHLNFNGPILTYESINCKGGNHMGIPSCLHRVRKASLCKV